MLSELLVFEVADLGILNEELDNPWLSNSPIAPCDVVEVTLSDTLTPVEVGAVGGGAGATGATVGAFTFGAPSNPAIHIVNSPLLHILWKPLQVAC